MVKIRARRANVLAGVIFMAAKASGTFLTLSNFQAVSTFALPLQCALAYDTPLQGCDNRDFGTGNTCSSSCLRAIQKVEKRVQESCAMVVAGQGSLLSRAQNGTLVSILCGNGSAPPSATTSATRPPPGTFSRIPDTFTTIPPDDATTSSTTTPIFVVPTTTPASGGFWNSTTTTSLSSTTSALNSASTSSTTRVVSASRTSISTTPRITPTNRPPSPRPNPEFSPSSSSTTNRPARPTQARGGGSPFDVPAPGRGGRTSINWGTGSFAIIFAWVGMDLLENLGGLVGSQ
ncbi:hypothetical protein AAL_02051 [Moelleriella libera RCEF 2490]|uniref:Uncharacterized protein n=1 Tax=Moelleriella libera RCEF 2490 TaxID=1081109 RepID=A0A168F4W9_9HYPO|nr:hypothetical protein AAL_02051 [Moelleriella libera RCEF 2490]